MPTVSEVAKEIGVSRQSIRDFVKEEFGITPEPRKAIVLTINQASVVASHFAKRKSSTAKDNAAVDQEEYRNLAQRCSDTLQKCAILEERLAAYEREIAFLRERLQVADDALKREQQQSRGFWHRLGTKMLGDGKTSRTNSEGDME